LPSKIGKRSAAAAAAASVASAASASQQVATCKMQLITLPAEADQTNLITTAATAQLHRAQLIPLCKQHEVLSLLLLLTKSCIQIIALQTLCCSFQVASSTRSERSYCFVDCCCCASAFMAQREMVNFYGTLKGSHTR